MFFLELFTFVFGQSKVREIIYVFDHIRVFLWGLLSKTKLRELRINSRDESIHSGLHNNVFHEFLTDLFCLRRNSILNNFNLIFWWLILYQNEFTRFIWFRHKFWSRLWAFLIVFIVFMNIFNGDIVFILIELRDLIFLLLDLPLVIFDLMLLFHQVVSLLLLVD